MPGFIGSSNDSSGAGSEIFFPKEFIDPVTKLRVSQPENLIDTDFEYGLQPTKWETVELINNTPSFFSKSGDTTIPSILSITTNAGTREITVVTALDHGLAVGIPIQVTGTKSITADGSYIINSIPNATTFTYLCKDDQPATSSIEDLYSSIITGEFFQGSQIRVADSSGIATDGASLSEITVTTESTHGFGINTPFYFLNLNSTISQEFQSANTASKSFDASNSATAQTFDGSNGLSSVNIDWSNSALVGGVASTISTVSTTNDTITVSHGTESFNAKPLGTPLYYDVVAGSGYFNTNPRGVVFLNSIDSLGISSSTFSVSLTPSGDNIDIDSSIAGTFQLANQARTFSGNNVNPVTQVTVDMVQDAAFSFEAANDGALANPTTYTTQATITGFSAGLVTVSASDTAKTLDFYQGAMVFYSTTGAAATGLSNNTTYFVDDFFATTPTGTYRLTLKTLPTDSAISSISGGTGTQTLTRIGVSLDKDIVHVKNSNFSVDDMVEYSYPEGGAFTSLTNKNFYFIENKYDTHNYTLKTDSPPNGLSAQQAGVSAAQLKADYGYTTDGAYWIKPTGWTGDPFLVHCIMSLEGGGWMLTLRNETNNFGAASRTPFGSQDFLVGSWTGWTYSTKAQVDAALGGTTNVANYAAANGTNAFSPVYLASPFNDVMVIANRDSNRRLGWRHNTQIANMRSVINKTTQTRGDTPLFGTAGGRAGYWQPTLDKRSDAQGTTDRGFQIYGFKIGSDRHGNDFGSGQMAGGWPNDATMGNTYNGTRGGWYNAQIGWAATDATTAEITGQIGGGFGGIDAAGSYHRLNHHVWGWGSSRSQATWDADRSSTYYGHAVYVR